MNTDAIYMILAIIPMLYAGYALIKRGGWKTVASMAIAFLIITALEYFFPTLVRDPSAPISGWFPAFCWLMAFNVSLMEVADKREETIRIALERIDVLSRNQANG